MSDRSQQVKSIFLEAIEKHAPEHWPAFLDQACAGDMVLRAGIEKRLRAQAEIGSFHEDLHPPIAGTIDDPITERPGTVIGPYKLLEQIGEGGFGVVFMAEQTQPVRRKVALKVLKPGMDTRQVVARFEAERQALAIMDHPNIAKVLDGGATASGRPFFVMELVKGVPITEHCDQNHLTPRERLDLFAAVCEAVQHAHQKGIVHRDLKPSNVLVTMHDTTPLVKVIDFGVAKALGQELTDKTLFTGFAQMIGTPLYMSPEQAGQSGLDIDTRSDIYSLGVLLYELLTGTTPFDKERFKQAAYDEIRRIIREEDPPRPSTRLSTTGQLRSIAANRSLEPKKLSGLIRGELDWIVMKAMEKDRTRRYETANGLARDVQRYLADEHVEACPPSVSYRFKKLLSRHRAGVLTATALLAVLGAGVVVSTWQAGRAMRAEALARNNEQQAITERDDKERARREAVANESKARAAAEAERQAKDAEASQRKQAEAAANLLESVFRGLDPTVSAQDLKQELARRLDEVAEKLEADYADEPLTRARLRTAWGLTQLGLGESAKAEALFQQALEDRRSHLDPDHRDTLRTMSDLADAYKSAGELDQALTLNEQTLAKRRAQFGPDDPDTLTSAHNLAMGYLAAGQSAKALPLLEETLQRQQVALGPDHPHTLTSMHNLAIVYRDSGRLDQALPLFERTLAQRQAQFGPNHSQTLQTLDGLASAYKAAGQLDKALPLFEQTYNTQQARFGPDHPHTLATLHNLGMAYLAAGQPAKALPLLEQAVERQTSQFGSNHPDTLVFRHNLALVYRDCGRLQEAVELLENTLEMQQAQLGADHPHTLQSMNSLGSVYQATRQPARALALFEQVLKEQQAKLGPDHAHTLATQHNLGMAYVAAGQAAHALPLLEQAVKKQAAQFGSDHPETLVFMYNLAVAYRDSGQLEKAQSLFEATLAKQQARLGLEHPQTLISMDNLAHVFEVQAQFDKAEPLLWSLLRHAQQSDGPQSIAAAHRLTNLGFNLLRQLQIAKAEPLLRESLHLFEQSFPDAWERYQAQSLLGAALAGQKQYVAAEPLLVQSYEGLKDREAKIPTTRKAVLPEALQRIVQLYDAWGKPGPAAEWRKKSAEAMAVEKSAAKP